MKTSESKRIDWYLSVPFFAVHFVALIGVFLVPFSWKYVGLAVALYYVRMFGITAGFHRYFSHKTYRLNRFWQFMMAFLAETSLQKGALWWAAHHRHHHKHSDDEHDLHSPKQDGFWWAHLGWFLSYKNANTQWELVKDLSKFPELLFLEKWNWVPGVLLAIALFVLGGAPALVWGFFVSTVVCWHGTYTINSLCHVFGSRRYQTTDTSRNNFWLSLLTMGEGWHNNHHCYQSSANQGFFWWEVDFTYYILKILSWVGIVQDLKLAPVERLESKRISLNSQPQSPEAVLEPSL